jgi:hypothetical protein
LEGIIEVSDEVGIAGETEACFAGHGTVEDEEGAVWERNHVGHYADRGLESTSS